jgi:hypothetical protein
MSRPLNGPLPHADVEVEPAPSRTKSAEVFANPIGAARVTEAKRVAMRMEVRMMLELIEVGDFQTERYKF